MVSPALRIVAVVEPLRFNSSPLSTRASRFNSSPLSACQLAGFPVNLREAGGKHGGKLSLGAIEPGVRLGLPAPANAPAGVSHAGADIVSDASAPTCAGMHRPVEEFDSSEANRLPDSGRGQALASRRPPWAVTVGLVAACAALVACNVVPLQTWLTSAQRAVATSNSDRMGVVHLAANGRIELLQLSEPWLASVKPSGQAGARVQRLQTLKQLPSQPVPSVQSAESGNWGKGTISIGPAQVQGSGEIAPAGKFTYLQAPRVHPRRPRNRYNYCECTERVCAHEIGSYALALYKHPVSVRARTINEYHHALESRWTRGQELANYRGPRAFRKPKLARGLGKRARVCQRTGPGRAISNHPSCLALGSISLPCVCSTVLFVATHNQYHLARAAGERAAAAGASASTAR